MKIKQTTIGELKWVLEFLNFKVDFSAKTASISF